MVGLIESRLAQRPWFAGGVAGPKDMVVVIDTSGSMRGRRIELAEEAATRVIDTLTASDYATVREHASPSLEGSLHRASSLDLFRLVSHGGHPTRAVAPPTH